MANSALDFNAMIQADREKRKREGLAQQMLGSRKSSAGAGSLPQKKGANGHGASLASRVGVTKRSSSAAPKPNIDGQWTHDLHDAGRRNSRPSSTAAHDRGNRLFAGLQQGLAGTKGTSNQANIRKAPTRASMSIRGMAAPIPTGPYVVVASNFAPGTTAADIEAAMQPVGGEVRSCKLVSANPTVMAELVFEDKDGADNVIATFNNQRADGRLLYVYLKNGGPTPGLHPLQTSSSAPASAVPTPAEAPAPIPEARPEVEARIDRDMMDVDEDRAPSRDDRSRRYDDRDRYRDDRPRDGYQDGRYGFNDRREAPRRPAGYGGNRGPPGRLYSDRTFHRGDQRYRP